MFVLIDIEWVTAEDGARHLTQLAALRTDKNWLAADSFDTLFCPPTDNADWSFIAFTGYSPAAFQQAPSTKEGLEAFAAWLQPDDVLCFWPASCQRELADQCLRFLGAALPQQSFHLDERMRRFMGGRRGNPYQLAVLHALPTPHPAHCAKNDVTVLHQVLACVGYPTARLAPPVPEPPAVRARISLEKRRDQIRRMTCNYLFCPDGAVFHTKSCPCMLRAREILGCVYYETAVEKRRPCKLCRPQPGAAPPPPEYTPDKHSAAPPAPIVRARMLGGETLEIKQSKLVGRCHNHLHPGQMTAQLLVEHDCLAKQCRFFEKYEDASYWQMLRQRQERRQKIRDKRRQQRQDAEAHALAMQQLIAFLQDCADRAHAAMDIIQVAATAPNRYTVFYVSDNPFADGNRFPQFLGQVHALRPSWRLLLRHIRDVDGHFVTRQEYANRPR